MNQTKSNKINKVIISGHSLGGAIAQIMGAFFYRYCLYDDECKDNIEFSEIITFGSPLVFNELNRVHPNSTHIINGNDLIGCSLTVLPGA